MADTHDLAIIRPGRDLELRRAALALDRERVVAGRLVRRGEPAEDATPLVVDARDLAVHERLRMHHLAAERLADGLVAETDPEQRHAPLEAVDHGERNAGLVR